MKDAYQHGSQPSRFGASHGSGKETGASAQTAQEEAPVDRRDGAFLESSHYPPWAWHLATLVCMFTVFVALDLLIYNLDPHVRERVLLWATLFFLVWPFVAAFVPKNMLSLLPCVPLFGVWLGLRYCGDMGPHGHMFLAIPPLIAGLLGVCIGTLVVLRRISFI